jgi:hypothetical protein
MLGDAAHLGAGSDGASTNGDEAEDAERSPDSAGPGEQADVEPPEGADTSEVSACEPPLSFMSDVVYVLPYSLAFLVPSGGTGAYEFLLTDDSIGTLNGTTGAFLAGSEPAVSSRAFATDTGCSGVAETRVDVVFPMDVAPRQPQVPPGTSIPFRVEEGSGHVTFELVTDETGASLDGQAYVAGEVTGVDVIRVRDTKTAEEVFVSVEVRDDALLVPTTWWPQVAVGQTLLFDVVGGTGDFTVTLSGGVASLEGGVLTGLQAGAATIEVVDDIAGLTLTIPLGVSAPLSSPANRSGDLSDHAALFSADFDGDGFEELLVGVSEADYTAHDSGGVFLYRGGESGVSDSPEQVYATDDQTVRAGTAIAVGDFNADGLPDLAIGVPRADPGVNDGGVVRIHEGVAGGLPAEEPSHVLGGPFSRDELGRTLVACDFNADGVDDLVAMAQQGENRALLQPFNEQGAVHLFLGRVEEGLPSTADQLIYGHVLVEGELVQQIGLRLGRSVAAGDFDGDGACDLVVSSINWSFDEVQLNREDGGVFLYRGRHAEADEEGGLESTPSRIWAANLETSVGTRFGYELAMADINDDGMSDLLVSQPRYKVPGQSGGNHGALNLFWGEPLANHPPEVLIPPSEAAWRGLGPLPNVLFGHDVHIADVGLNGSLDLIVADPRGINDEGVRSGVVYVYEYVSESGVSDTPTEVVAGIAAQDYFGTGVTVVDGVVAVMASRDDAHGLDVGCPYKTTDGESLPLAFPGIGTGDAYGQSVSFTGDLTGDGLEDLAVGVPMEDAVELGANAGVVMIYRGTTTGVESEPAAVLKGFRTHTAGDQFGKEVLDMGDVDGDGFADLGVLSGIEELPGINAFGDGLFNDGACEFGSPNVGALYIFRGTSDGAPQAEPAFIVYGLKAGSRLDSVLGGVDVNGDGRDDIIAGNPTYDVPAEPELNEDGELVPVNGQGAVAVYFGQPSAATGTTVVLCSPAAIITGRQNAGRFGQTLASLGDLDGDGCSDFVVSGVNEEYTGLLEGGLHLIRGWGKQGCPDAPRVSVFAPGIDGVRSGSRLTGGLDLDGDEVPDLVMANPGFTANLLQQGMIWLVSGAYLASAPTYSQTDWTLEDVKPMWPFNVPAEVYRYAGPTKQARFGTSLALYRPFGEVGPAQVIVGAPNGAESGIFAGGGAYALEFSTTDGFAGQPTMIFGGESARALSKLGTSVATGYVGEKSMAVVGGPGSSAVTVDNGSAYVLDLTP